MTRFVFAVALAVIAHVAAGQFSPQASPVEAHPGGTDGNGCHTCRTNCVERWGISYGYYHRHNPVRGCFSTQPAPAPTVSLSPWGRCNSTGWVCWNTVERRWIAGDAWRYDPATNTSQHHVCRTSWCGQWTGRVWLASDGSTWVKGTWYKHPYWNNCHPSYPSGTDATRGGCIRAGEVDYDCWNNGNPTGNGPYYAAGGPFQVLGPDTYGLDSPNDADNIACENG